MEVAVISDIHGNYEAFKACFEFCASRGIDRFLFLGDYVTDCPDPEKTMELLYIIRDYFRCAFIRGNREERLLRYRAGDEGEWKNGSAAGSLLYTYERLTDRDLYFFEKLPIYDVWQEPGFPPIALCHGTPERANGLMLRGKPGTRRILMSCDAPVLVHGHHHVQESFSHSGKLCVNPGSVGVPWHHGGMAQFAILKSQGKEWTEELIQIEYDREAEIRAFIESDLCLRAPAWAALTLHTLRTGIDESQAVFLRASQLCRKSMGEAVWPGIPEKFWAQALREHGIDLKGRDIGVTSKY